MMVSKAGINVGRALYLLWAATTVLAVHYETSVEDRVNGQATETWVHFTYRKADSSPMTSTSSQLAAEDPLPTLVYNCAKMPHICGNVENHPTLGGQSRTLWYDGDNVRKEVRADIACPDFWAQGEPLKGMRPVVPDKNNQQLYKPGKLPNCPDASSQGLTLPRGTWYSCDEFPARSTVQGGNDATSVCAPQKLSVLGMDNPLTVQQLGAKADSEQDFQGRLHAALSNSKSLEQQQPGGGGKSRKGDGKIHAFILSLTTDAAAQTWGYLAHPQIVTRKTTQRATTTLQPPPLPPGKPRTTVRTTSTWVSTTVTTRAVGKRDYIPQPTRILVPRQMNQPQPTNWNGTALNSFSAGTGTGIEGTGLPTTTESSETGPITSPPVASDPSSLDLPDSPTFSEDSSVASPSSENQEPSSSTLLEGPNESSSASASQPSDSPPSESSITLSSAESSGRPSSGISSISSAESSGPSSEPISESGSMSDSTSSSPPASSEAVSSSSEPSVSGSHSSIPISSQASTATSGNPSLPTESPTPPESSGFDPEPTKSSAAPSSESTADEPGPTSEPSSIVEPAPSDDPIPTSTPEGGDEVIITQTTGDETKTDTITAFYSTSTVELQSSTLSATTTKLDEDEDDEVILPVWPVKQGEHGCNSLFCGIFKIPIPPFPSVAPPEIKPPFPDLPEVTIGPDGNPKPKGSGNPENPDDPEDEPSTTRTSESTQQTQSVTATAAGTAAVIVQFDIVTDVYGPQMSGDISEEDSKEQAPDVYDGDGKMLYGPVATSMSTITGSPSASEPSSSPTDSESSVPASDGSSSTPDSTISVTATPTPTPSSVAPSPVPSSDDDPLSSPSPIPTPTSPSPAALPEIKDEEINCSFGEREAMTKEAMDEATSAFCEALSKDEIPAGKTKSFWKKAKLVSLDHREFDGCFSGIFRPEKDIKLGKEECEEVVRKMNERCVEGGDRVGATWDPSIKDGGVPGLGEGWLLEVDGVATMQECSEEGELKDL